MVQMNTLMHRSAITGTEERHDNLSLIQNFYSEIATQRSVPVSSSRENCFSKITDSEEASGLKDLETFFTKVGEAFPDYELRIHNIFAKGDKVMARYSISGTQTEYFMGVAPTNRKMTITGIDIFRLNEGKVVEYWDAAHQIGAFVP